MVYVTCVVIPHPFVPSLAVILLEIFTDSGWKEEYTREGAKPPLKFSPPLEQKEIRILIIILFERGIKGVSYTMFMN